jgi:hypothetical protein
VVAEHMLRATKHKRYVLPEHEAEFRLRSTSRHVLAEQFARLGSAAEAFAEGLRQSRGAKAGYHMSKILELADRVGVVRVADALRQAARYGAFDHGAVARIIAGKPPPAAIATAPAASPPERIVEYLRGAGSHQRDLDSYQQLAELAAPASSTEHTEDDGQRRDRTTAPEPATPGAPPRRSEPR